MNDKLLEGLSRWHGNVIFGEVTNEALELQQYRAIGPIDRLRELADADKDGRVVVLPCKVGDTVYIADGWGKRVHEYKVNKIGIIDGAVLCYQSDYEQPITPDIWDKTVFLTREEAEATLGAMR